MALMAPEEVPANIILPERERHIWVRATCPAGNSRLTYVRTGTHTNGMDKSIEDGHIYVHEKHNRYVHMYIHNAHTFVHITLHIYTYIRMHARVVY